MKWLSLICLMILPALGSAMDENSPEEKKTLLYSYPLNAETYVEIQNKYGNVEVDLWDKDSIEVRIEITVQSDKDEDLDEMMGLLLSPRS